MRICHIADIHLSGAHDDTGETLEEQVERLKWIVNDANHPDLIVVAGDTFHARSNAFERNAAVVAYVEMSNVAPVVVVKGNNAHDGPGEIAFLGQLRTKHQIYVFERPGSVVVDDALVCCLPFPEKAWLASRLGPGQNIGEAAAQVVRSILTGFGAAAARYNGPSVLVAHLELGAALLDSGQPMVGHCFVDVSEADLMVTGVDYVALGHIHKHQVLGDGRICYAGSPRQTTFGEDADKGYCLVTVEHGDLAMIEHRKAPGPDLETIDAEFVNGRLLEDGADIIDSIVVNGNVYRLQYEVQDDARAAALEQANEAKKRWLSDGARSVKIDARVHSTARVRSESIAEARTNNDRMRALWNLRGETPAREQQISAKLETLEREVVSG